MKVVTKSIFTKSGYQITPQNITDSVNHIIIRDCNLYPDSDYRSQETREWIIPINNTKDMVEIGELLIEMFKLKQNDSN